MSRLILTTIALFIALPAAIAEPVGFAYRSRVVGDPFVPPVGDPAPGVPYLNASTRNPGPGFERGFARADFTTVPDWTPGDGAVRVAGVAVTAAASPEGFHAVFDADRVDGYNSGHYTLTVEVKDLLTQATGEFAFRGILDGGLELETDSPLSSTLSNASIGPTSLEGRVGDALYRVTLAEWGQPGAPELVLGGSATGDEGVMSATIERVGAVAETPEPATLVLAGLGAVAVGCRRLGAGRVLT